MFSHIHLGVTSFPRALAFYADLMKELGLVLKFSDLDKSWAGWMKPGMARPLFLIGHPADGGPALPGNGQMVALLAESRAVVDSCYRRALSMGGTDEGCPALRPQYHSDFYGAYFRDPDGNKLCVCCHDPAGGATS